MSVNTKIINFDSQYQGPTVDMEILGIFVFFCKLKTFKVSCALNSGRSARETSFLTAKISAILMIDQVSGL